MNLLFTAAVVIGLCTAPAQAITPPTPEMKTVIQSGLTSVNAIQTQIQEVDRQISDGRNGSEKIHQLELARKALAKQRDLEYNIVIRQTMVAYGLVPIEANLKPKMPSGKTVYPNFSDRHISWLVLYMENVPRTSLGNNGEAVVIAPGNATLGGGVTYADGITTIYGRFSTADELAILLRHEQIHFEQLTTKGVGDRFSKSEAERDVREKLIREVGSFGLAPEITEAAKASLRRDILKLDAKILEEKSISGRIRRIGRPEEPFVLEAHTQPEYDVIARQGNVFDETLASGERDAAEKSKRAKIEAEHDRDNRLREALIDIVARSCANPGSVSQEELDNLAKPNDPNFYCERLNGFCSTPSGVATCGTAYLNMGATLGGGGRLDAGDLRAATTPSAPVTSAKPLESNPPPAPAVGARSNNLWFSLPELRDLAVAACRSSGEAPIDPKIAQPDMPYSFEHEADNSRAAELSAGLSDCEKPLFRRLIEMIRSRQEAGITRQWLRDRVEEYMPHYVSPPRYISPPAHSDPCRDNGNIRCP